MLNTRSFLVGQGQISAVTSNMLSASDAYSDPTKLIFFISGLQHGNFLLSTNQSCPISNFFQHQITANQVQFKHDGTLSLPSFNISVSSGVLTTEPVEAMVKFDLAPKLQNNNITIGQGATLTIKPTMLSATDPDVGDTLTFSSAEVTHGIFDSIFNPGISITQFTQSQVVYNMIRFVHDNSLSASSYKISVSDGVVVTPFQLATVIFDVAPVLVRNQLSIGQGQVIAIISSMLNATDVDTDPTTLLFRSSNTKHGQFALAADYSVVKAEFSQADVKGNNIVFIHDGTNIAPGYEISVDDKIVTTTPASAKITFYRQPTLLAQTLGVNQGQTVVVTPSMLSAAATITKPNTLVFTVSRVLHGKFTFISNPAIAITAFTQQDIINNWVQFTHDNSQIAPSCSISVTDGFVIMPATTMIINFDAAPVLSANQLTLHQGESVVMTSSMLSATDKDSNMDTLTFQVSSNCHGSFWLHQAQSDVMVNAFLQEQIAAKVVSFQHDGSGYMPAYKIAVSDGIIITEPMSAALTFIPTPISNNTVIGAATGAGVSGVIGIGVWLMKKYVDSKSKKEFSGKSLQNQLCVAIIERMKVSGCLGYMSSELIQEFRFAINKMLKELRQQGIGINFEKLALEEQQQLVKTIALQTEKILLPPRTCYSKFVRFFKDYCVTEIVPEQIESNAKAIGKAVSVELDRLNQMRNLNGSATLEVEEKSTAATSIVTTIDHNQSPSIEMTSAGVAAKDEEKLELELQAMQEENAEVSRKVRAMREILKGKSVDLFKQEPGASLVVQAASSSSSESKIAIARV